MEMPAGLEGQARASTYNTAQTFILAITSSDAGAFTYWQLQLLQSRLRNTAAFLSQRLEDLYTVALSWSMSAVNPA